MKQFTHQLLMIRPVGFAFNAETAVNNSFQVPTNQQNVQQQALHEFDIFVQKLQSNGIDVTVVNDTPEPFTPDSIFPNNWISFHTNTICLYPMFAENRRLERKQSVLEAVKQKFNIEQTIDFTEFEQTNIFNEGTGSMVLDRENNIAYACLSVRTQLPALQEFCSKMNYKPVTFIANDVQGQPIYHTNVMMCVANKFVVVCLECVTNLQERAFLKSTIQATGKEIIEISYHQMNHFAGNMLQVGNLNGDVFLVMSSQAYHVLTTEQIASIEKYNTIIHSSLETIETNGGGSARCMMAEVFLNAKA
ncbi:MAG: citrulline utilization hydrolase CtlX [Chitinophagaceae bacterium]